MVFLCVGEWACHRYLFRNSLTGTVPAELSTLTTLTSLCATRHASPRLALVHCGARQGRGAVLVVLSSCGEAAVMTGRWWPRARCSHALDQTARSQ